MSKKAKHLQGMTPGELLLEEFLNPMGMSQTALAEAINVPSRRINEIILGKRAITLDTSIRLGRFFKQHPEFWLGIQQQCDLWEAEDLIRKIQKQIKPYTYYFSLKRNKLKKAIT